MINPIGKAAMIATDCKLYIEFLANINAIGNKIKITAQDTLIFLSGSSSTSSFLYEYDETTIVKASNVVE